MMLSKEVQVILIEATNEATILIEATTVIEATTPGNFSTWLPRAGL